MLLRARPARSRSRSRTTHMLAARVAAATLIAALALAGACAGAPPLDPRPLGGRELVVVSYNVNYGVPGHPDALGALDVIDADLVLLQETTPAWERALTHAFRARYPHRIFHHDGGAGGLAVLSKHPIDDDELLPAVTWFPAWRGVVRTPHGPIEALNVHLRPPFDDDGSVVTGVFVTPDLRRAEIEAFADALDGRFPVVVAGDFNEGRGAALDHLRRARGLDDALDRLPGQVTWRWPLPVVTLEGRYDHVFYDARALALVDVAVLEVAASDHYPVVAVLASRDTRAARE